MQLETKTVPFAIKSADVTGSEFTGLAASYLSLDGGRDIIAPGAYTKHLDHFCKEGKIRNEHETTVGRITDARETSGGLMISGKISDTSVGRDVKTLLRDGVITKLSIGHYVRDKIWLETPEEVKSYWRSMGYTPSERDLARAANGARLVREAQPIECSTTFMSLNENCAIMEVKSAATEAERQRQIRGMHGSLLKSQIDFNNAWFDRELRAHREQAERDERELAEWRARHAAYTGS